MTSKQNQDWLSEFSEFVQADTTIVPQELSEKVWSQVQSLLNPNPAFVFVKILGIHFIAGFLSLAICTQFGINPFGLSWSLSDVFTSFGGHGFCMVACGGLFISLSLATAGFFLTIEEVRALRRTEFLQTLAIGVISLGLFAVAGAELALTLAGLWMLGILIGGFVATEAVWQIKRV